MLVCAWAMVLTLTLSAPTLPQLLDYARRRAAAAHVPTSLELYADTLVYVAGVEHLPLAAFLLLASLLGFWYARQHWFVWMCIAGPLVIQGAFVELADALVSPRLYISMLFPLVVGLALLIERTRTSAHQMTRVARFVIPLLMIGDSVPLFTRYYTVGSPDLRELAARISSSEVFLAHDQGDMNTYYFTQSESNTDAAEVLRILPTLQPSPRFVLSGRDCRRPARELETLGYHPRLTLADWTMAEHAETQRRPCFTLFEASR
jgi:hypothetical protein